MRTSLRLLLLLVAGGGTAEHWSTVISYPEEGVSEMAKTTAAHGITDKHAQHLSLFQPESMTVVEGSTVTLHCTFNIIEETAIGHTSWSYGRDNSSATTEVSNKTESYRGRIFQTNQSTSFAKGKAAIAIQGVRPYDTGRYVCEVEVFGIGSGRGNGTWLQVVIAVPITEKVLVTIEKEVVQIPMNFILQMGRTVLVLLIFGLSVLMIMRCYARKEAQFRATMQAQANLERRGRHPPWAEI